MRAGYGRGVKQPTVSLAVAAALRESIAAGQLRPGDMMPTYRQAAARFGVAPKTVARAYAQLAAEGVVSTPVQGCRTVVASPPG